MLAVALVGCASPLGLSMSSPERLHQAYFYDLCDSWLVMRDPRVLEELRSRNLYSAEEMAQITRHTISVGMSASAARCSWGGSFREHTSELFGSSMLIQRAYDSGAYVYIQDAKVSGYQN
jgi:hypothetical protein